MGSFSQNLKYLGLMSNFTELCFSDFIFIFIETVCGDAEESTIYT